MIADQSPDDDDLSAMWRAHKKDVKQHRATMLAKADTTGWKQHSEYHFSRTFNGKRMDLWPSGGKAMYDGQMIYGHSKVNARIARFLGDSSQPTVNSDFQ